MEKKDLRKEVWIPYSTAIMMLVFGIVLTSVAYADSVDGEISSSVTGIFGECLLYAASIFGVGTFCKRYIDKRLNSTKGQK